MKNYLTKSCKFGKAIQVLNFGASFHKINLYLYVQDNKDIYFCQYHQKFYSNSPSCHAEPHFDFAQCKLRGEASRFPTIKNEILRLAINPFGVMARSE